MLELLFAAFLYTEEPDIIICIFNEETKAYTCEEEVYDGMSCSIEHNIMMCERLIEV
jgi:hypothetical protein